MTFGLTMAEIRESDAFSQRSNSRNSASGRPMLMATFCSDLPGLSTDNVARR